MTAAEVLTTALAAAWFFGGNQRSARAFLREGGFLPALLCEGQFNRRLHALGPQPWQGVLDRLSEGEAAGEFLIASGPVPVCHLRRAQRCRLYPDTNGAYYGYCAAKEEYFYGLNAHTVVTASGLPVEGLWLCGCGHDLTGMKERALGLPGGARLYGDKADTDYKLEDALQAQKSLTLLAIRKGNSKRPHVPEVAERLRKVRKRIETTFSQIAARLARRIHAVTPAGFEGKVMAAFVAYAILGANNLLVEACRAAS